MEAAAKQIMQRVIDAGGEIYLVGGAVRDIISNRQVKDWDFTTNLPPEAILKIFSRQSFYNNQFGTVSVIGPNKQIFEITTFRTEIGYQDKRHPDQICWGKSLEEDICRRDFTINALAMDLNGKIYDFCQGENDLKNKLIRAVGNPNQRFEEDALRMMRAVRIASELGFSIEETTLVSIKKNAHLIKEISAERIRDELFKILLAPFNTEGIILLKNSGLLKEIIPELLEGVEVTQKGHHIYDVFQHNLETLKNCQSKNVITLLACLLHDVAKPKVAKGEGREKTFYNHEVIGSRMAVNIGKRLKLSNKELDQLFKLTRWHMFTTSEFQTDKAIRRFIRKVTPKYINEMIALRRADRIGSGSKETSWRWELFKKRIIEVQKQPFSIKDLKINGNDVMRVLKIKPGPSVGQILKKLFTQVEKNPQLNQRAMLLKALEKENQRQSYSKRGVSTANTANK